MLRTVLFWLLIGVVFGGCAVALWRAGVVRDWVADLRGVPEPGLLDAPGALAVGWDPAQLEAAAHLRPAQSDAERRAFLKAMCDRDPRLEFVEDPQGRWFGFRRVG